MKNELFVSCAIVAFFQIPLATPVAAQDQGGSSGNTSEMADTIAGNTIVVTANKREENVQDVPATIDVIGGAALERAGINDIADLQQAVPGLAIEQVSLWVQPSLRGINSRGSTAGDEANVAIYLDGVYQPAMTSNAFELINVERVEVLKGPQGTLYGRNATGGAINVITAKPSDDAVAKISLSYGRFNEIRTNAYVAGPIAAGLSADLALQNTYGKGYITDLFAPSRNHGDNVKSIRARVRWQPSDTVDLIAAFSRTDRTTRSVFAVQPINGNTVAISVDPDVVLPEKTWQYAGNEDARGKSGQSDFSLQADIDLGAVLLQSVSDIQKNSMYFQNDQDATAVPNRTSIIYDLPFKTWSQDFRLISQHGGPLQWVAGVTAFDSDAQYDPLISGSTQIRGRQQVRAYAGYAEGTLNIADDLYVTAGLRYSWEKRTFDPFVNTARPRVTATFKDLTPHGSIRYQLSPYANIYYSYGEGFKSGIFNTASSSSTPVNPETVTAHEVGVKLEPASWARLNVAGFYSSYKDLQTQTRGAGADATTITQNAGLVDIWGVDVDLTISPSRGLTLQFAGEYLDTKIKDFANAAISVPKLDDEGQLLGGNKTISQDISGNPILIATKLSLVARGSYEADLGDGSLKLDTNVSYNDGYSLELGNRIRQPAFTMVNASIGWWTGDHGLGVTLWARNLANEKVALYTTIGGNGDFSSYQRPRSYGVRLNANF